MPTTVNVPREKTLDNTLAFFREGYLFIKNRMDQYQTDLFITRLLGEEVICITGKVLAKMFYDPEKFRRKGTVPYRIQQSLFGVNAIQTMDGDAHLQRKQLLLSILKPPQQHTLAQMVLDGGWKRRKNGKNKADESDRWMRQRPFSAKLLAAGPVFRSNVPNWQDAETILPPWWMHSEQSDRATGKDVWPETAWRPGSGTSSAIHV